jgi:excisionase family DNA binding protein
MNTDTLTTPRLLPPKKAAAYLAISERKLWSLTTVEKRIPAVRFGRCVRYDLTDLDTFIAAAKGQQR